MLSPYPPTLRPAARSRPREPDTCVPRPPDRLTARNPAAAHSIAYTLIREPQWPLTASAARRLWGGRSRAQACLTLVTCRAAGRALTLAVCATRHLREGVRQGARGMCPRSICGLCPPPFWRQLRRRSAPPHLTVLRRDAPPRTSRTGALTQDVWGGRRVPLARAAPPGGPRLCRWCAARHLREGVARGLRGMCPRTTSSRYEPRLHTHGSSSSALYAGDRRPPARSFRLGCHLRKR